MIAFALFDTAIGRCAIAWSDAGIVDVWFPEASDDALRARVRRRHADAIEAAPTTSATAAIDAVNAIVRGEDAALAVHSLDERDVPPFHRRVYDIALTIPRGRTRTYGDLAKELGDPALARAVGQALGANPWPILVPCHRIVGAGNWDGGFSGAGGTATKRKLLEIEGAREPPPPSLFD